MPLLPEIDRRTAERHTASLAADPGFGELRAHIDGRLKALLPRTRFGQDALGNAMSDAALAPGKRIRPLVVILAGRQLGCDAPALLDAGCALELVHTASLLLDDLPCMDDAKLRRGRPATHVRFGEDVAVLAAIALLSRAFGIVAAAPGIAAEKQAQCAATLANAVGTSGLVGGQFYDLHAVNGGALGDITATNHLKTGVLFTAAIDLACTIADASRSEAGHLHGFADELGQAFQLLDDLLDSLSTADAIGKDVGQDTDKFTIVNLVGLDRSRDRLAEYIGAMQAHLARLDGPENSLSVLVEDIFRGISA